MDLMRNITDVSIKSTSSLNGSASSLQDGASSLPSQHHLTRPQPLRLGAAGAGGQEVGGTDARTDRHGQTDTHTHTDTQKERSRENIDIQPKKL